MKSTSKDLQNRIEIPLDTFLQALLYDDKELLEIINRLLQQKEAQH